MNITQSLIITGSVGLMAGSMLAANMPPQLPLPNPSQVDWLIDGSAYKAVVKVPESKKEIVLENGLARRVFRIASNAATIDLQNLSSGERYLRAIAPEARVKLDGVDYEVGGLKGAPIANYINAA